MHATTRQANKDGLDLKGTWPGVILNEAAFQAE
jgi:hypothetical protein